MKRSTLLLAGAVALLWLATRKQADPDLQGAGGDPAWYNAEAWMAAQAAGAKQ